MFVSISQQTQKALQHKHYVELEGYLLEGVELKDISYELDSMNPVVFHLGFRTCPCVCLTSSVMLCCGMIIGLLQLSEICLFFTVKSFPAD